MTNPGDPPADPAPNRRRNWADLGPRVGSALVLIAITATTTAPISNSPPMRQLVPSPRAAMAMAQARAMTPAVPSKPQSGKMAAEIATSPISAMPVGVSGLRVTMVSHSR